MEVVHAEVVSEVNNDVQTVSDENDDVQTVSDENDDVQINEENDDLEVGMTFVSFENLFLAYKNHAKKKGFPVKKHTQKKDDNGIIRWVTFACSREGRNVGSSCNLARPYPTSKTGCKAKLSSCLQKDGSVRISKIIDEHNHSISPTKVRHFRCNRQISAAAKRRLINNDISGIRVNKNFNSLAVEAGGNENLEFIEMDARNLIDKMRRLRFGEGDASAVQRYFVNMQRLNSGFFFSIDLDEDGRLRNVFWADARSREAYKEFGEVITFDTTYLVNKYDMPFAPFVGVNHHGHSILLGCGLISFENADTFEWLFETWLSCMNGSAPIGIITDQDPAMKIAVARVFPNTRHRWCLWHIMMKLPEKFGKCTHYESISYALKNAVYDSQTPAEFEDLWSAMVETYDLHQNAWLTTMYNDRNRWVPCYLKNTFWAGMSTTQRSESVNAFFDGFVNSKTTLKSFVEQYGNALRAKVEKESQADFKSFAQVLPCVTPHQIEKQVQSKYTMDKFREFQREIVGTIMVRPVAVKEDDMVTEYDLVEDIKVGEIESLKAVMFKVRFNHIECSISCSCQNFKFRGMLCRHALAVLFQNHVTELPEMYILRRWRKDVRRRHTRVPVHYDGWIPTVEQLRYEEMCNLFSEVSDLAADGEETYKDVVEWIRTKVTNLRSMGTKVTTAIVASATVDILDPKCVRGKGRPPELRKKAPAYRKSKKTKAQVPCQPNEQDGIAFVPSLYKAHQMLATQESMVDLLNGVSYSNPVFTKSQYSIAEEGPMIPSWESLGSHE